MRLTSAIFPTLFVTFAIAVLCAGCSLATQPPAMRSWNGSLSAGLAVTSGNTDTATTNLAFTVETDKTKRNIVKAEGLNIRSSKNGDSIVDRTSLQLQDELALTPRAYTFARVQYLRDTFKSINFLVAPTFGFGYRFLNSEKTSFVADIAGGSVVENNPGLMRKTTGAVTSTEKASHKISDTATVTQSLTALWKTSDPGDALYTFQVGVAANLTQRVQIKVDFLDTYKRKPPSAGIERNDTAFLTSLGFKF